VTLLLDTHVVIWWWSKPDRLRRDVRQTIATADLVLVSAASAWETVVKAALGKLELPAAFSTMVEDAGFKELPIRFNHATALAALPPHHRDPFDRMLIAQAVTDRATVVTHDPQFKPYSVNILWT
jgi:PIN domain nuclease of toxin-antitoxin system